MNIYITGDKHRDFKSIINFCNENNTSVDDILIILGDAGINYYGDNRGDFKLKKKLSKLPITLFCIYGNHEKRPSTIEGYKLQQFNEGLVYKQSKYPNLLFAKCGESYIFNNKKYFVIDGAYSVDKHYRLSKGFHWFKDEQPSEENKKFVESNLNNINWKVDYVLTHTCPYKYMPTEWFMPCINQDKVDNSTEKWLDIIEDKLNYQKWYCGHFHGSKKIDKIQFMFEEFEKL